MAVPGHQRLPAPPIRFWDGYPLVSLPQGGFTPCQAVGRNLAADVLPCAPGASAGTCALVGHTPRRSIGKGFGGFHHPLLQPCWCLHCFHQHAGRGALFLYGVLVLASEGLGRDALLVCGCSPRPLERLAGGPAAEKDAARTGETARIEAHRAYAGDSLASTGGCADGRAAGAT